MPLRTNAGLDGARWYTRVSPELSVIVNSCVYIHGVGCCSLQDPEVYCFVIRGVWAIHCAGCERAHHDTVPLGEGLTGQGIVSIIIIAARGPDDVGL